MLSSYIAKLNESILYSQFVEDIGSRRRVPSLISENVVSLSKVINSNIQDYNDLKEVKMNNLDM